MKNIPTATRLRVNAMSTHPTPLNRISIIAIHHVSRTPACSYAMARNCRRQEISPECTLIYINAVPVRCAVGEIGQTFAPRKTDILQSKKGID
jgi:hypothetical protein